MDLVPGMMFMPSEATSALNVAVPYSCGVPKGIQYQPGHDYAFIMFTLSCAFVRPEAEPQIKAELVPKEPTLSVYPQNPRRSTERIEHDRDPPITRLMQMTRGFNATARQVHVPNLRITTFLSAFSLSSSTEFVFDIEPGLGSLITPKKGPPLSEAPLGETLTWPSPESGAEAM